MKHRNWRTSAPGIALALATPFASAHVVMQKWTALAGCQEFVTLAVPHGCGASPTTEVRVKVPEGITGTVLCFKTIQGCARVETRWVDTIPAGEPTWKIWAMPAPSPSPFIELEQAPGPQLGATMQQIGAERAKRGGAAGPK